MKPGELEFEPAANSTSQKNTNQQLKYSCSSPAARGTTNPALRKFTKNQFLNTLNVVIGSVADDPVIQEESNSLPDETITIDNDQVAPNHDAGYAVVLNKIADRVVKLTSDDTNTRKAIFGDCALKTPVTAACADGFINSFGKKVFRRPLNTEEFTKYKQIYTSQGADFNGLLSAFYVMFQSPAMAFVLDFGNDQETGRSRLNDYEIASRISYAVLDSPPDAELLAAASRTGELQSLDKVEAQVRRLLSSTNADARSRIIGIARFYTGITNKENPSPLLGAALGINVSKLSDEMMKEFDDFVSYVFWTGGTFEDLMTSRVAFPRTETMRSILGASKVASGSEPAMASEHHLGLLHRPAFLSNASERSSPILRGAHIRNHILCDNIPFPAQELVETELERLGDVENNDNRTRVKLTTSSSACIGCHSQINDLGFPFENFDQFGALRTFETVYDEKGAVAHTWPITTNSQIKNMEKPTGVTEVQNSRDLATVISDNTKARACFTKKIIEFVKERKTNTNTDSCALSDVEKALKEGSLKDAFIRSVANEDIFWRN